MTQPSKIEQQAQAAFATAMRLKGLVEQHAVDLAVENANLAADLKDARAEVEKLKADLARLRKTKNIPPDPAG